ncbi:AgmX/PglI C-terminal domain-containing protein [Thalassotalea aquiviva]|uniref:AgmX/PglI C-terminal domain-containing protein n=1 Tax=Thalassotalea aquiviva TaxID=3242415 RepID=UPI00352A4340
MIEDNDISLRIKQDENKRLKWIVLLLLCFTLPFFGYVCFVDLPKQLQPIKTKPVTQFVRIQKTEQPDPKPKRPSSNIEQGGTSEAETPQLKSANALAMARKRAKNSGLLALSNQLSGLKDAVELNKLTPNVALNAPSTTANPMPFEQPDSDVNQHQQILSQVATQRMHKPLTNSTVNTQGKRLSDELNIVDVEHDLTLKKQYPLVSQTDRVGSDLSAPSTPIESKNTAPVESRSVDSIRLILDKNKGALYSIYRRALRKKPDIEGKFTVNLEISAQGQVSLANMLVSELNFAELENKLIRRIKLIQFGQKGTESVRINYTFNFMTIS